MFKEKDIYHMDIKLIINKMRDHSTSLIPMYANLQRPPWQRRPQGNRAPTLYDATANVKTRCAQILEGVVVVDIGEKVSPKAAECFLLPTGTAFSSPSKPSSVFIYRCTGDDCEKRISADEGMTKVRWHKETEYKLRRAPAKRYFWVFDWHFNYGPTLATWEQIAISALGLDLASSYINDYREDPGTCLTDMARDLAAGGWAQELVENYMTIFKGYIVEGDPYIDLKPSASHRIQCGIRKRTGAYPRRMDGIVISNRTPRNIEAGVPSLTN